VNFIRNKYLKITVCSSLLFSFCLSEAAFTWTNNPIVNAVKIRKTDKAMGRTKIWSGISVAMLTATVIVLPMLSLVGFLSFRKNCVCPRCNKLIWKCSCNYRDRDHRALRHVCWMDVFGCVIKRVINRIDDVNARFLSYDS